MHRTTVTLVVNTTCLSGSAGDGWHNTPLSVTEAPSLRSTLGNIDARNGGAYAAQTTIPFLRGVTYNFRLVINVPAHTYSIYVMPAGGTEQIVGTNFTFRTEQKAVTALDWWGLNVNSSNPGSLAVCNFVTR